MTIINKVTKKIELKLGTTSSQNITNTYLIPGFSDTLIYESPLLQSNGFMDLKIDRLSWKQITPGYDANLLEIHSSDDFYLKLEKDENTSFIIQTKSFSYNNPDIPIKASINNGSLIHDPNLDVFVSDENSVDMTVYFLVLGLTN